MDYELAYFGLGFIFCMVMDIFFSISAYFLEKARYYRKMREWDEEE